MLIIFKFSEHWEGNTVCFFIYCNPWKNKVQHQCRNLLLIPSPPNPVFTDSMPRSLLPVGPPVQPGYWCWTYCQKGLLAGNSRRRTWSLDKDSSVNSGHSEGSMFQQSGCRWAAQGYCCPHPSNLKGRELQKGLEEVQKVCITSA